MSGSLLADDSFLNVLIQSRQTNTQEQDMLSIQHNVIRLQSIVSTEPCKLLEWIHTECDARTTN